MLKGYTDVHVVFGVVQGLRRRGMDVVTAQDREQDEADDAELLADALADQRVMLTNDADFLVYGRRAAPTASSRRVFQPQRLRDPVPVGNPRPATRLCRISVRT